MTNKARIVAIFGCAILACAIVIVIVHANFYDLVGRQGRYIDERAEAFDGAFHVVSCLEIAHSQKANVSAMSVEELSNRFGKSATTRIAGSFYPIANYEIVSAKFTAEGTFVGVVVVRESVTNNSREFVFDFRDRGSSPMTVHVTPPVPEE